jgi:hypothetical protein
MKTVIQLLIVVLLLNAAFQSARAYYTFYDYRDSLLEEAHHGRVDTTSQLHQRALDLGTEYGLNVAWDDVQVRLETGQTVIDFSYVDQVPFIPKYFVKPWLFNGSVSAFRPRPLVVDER